MANPSTTLHYAANSNVNGIDAAATLGFNLADVSSLSTLNALPVGVKGLVYLGMTDGVTPAFQAAVAQYIGNPNLFGFYLVDEPNPSTVSAANLMAEADYIHANAPGAATFMMLQNLGSPAKPVFNYNSANTHIDYFGLDPYPVQTQFNGANYSIISIAVQAALASGIALNQIIPVYQAFGGGGYPSWILPTAAQEQQILAAWGAVVPTPAFDMTYSWGTQNGDAALSGSADLQQIFAALNGVASIAGNSGGVTMTATSNQLFIASAATVAATGATPGIFGGAGAAWFIANAGTVSSSGSYAISLNAPGHVVNLGAISGVEGIGLNQGGGVVNYASGRITGTGAAGAAIFASAKKATVDNSGVISSANYNGIMLTAGGSVTNESGGSIAAKNAAIFISGAAGSLVNGGAITASAGVGVDFEAGGRVANNASQLISGGVFGVFIGGGSGALTNSGAISGTSSDGVLFTLGGSLANAAGASITGGTNAVYFKAGPTSNIANAGAIVANGSAGIDLDAGGSISNSATGVISGLEFGVFTIGGTANINNAGAIAATLYDGIALENGGTIANAAGAIIRGGSNAVFISNRSTGSVTNAGSIIGTSSGSAGLDIEGGGTVANQTGGAITGAAFGLFMTGAMGTVANDGAIVGSHGVSLNAGGVCVNTGNGQITGQTSGVAFSGAAGTLTNAGQIRALAAGGAGVDIESGGSVTNLAGGSIIGASYGVFNAGGNGVVRNAGTIQGGTYAVYFAGATDDRLIVDAGAVFVGAVEGGGGTNTLELAAGNAGSIGGIGSSAFHNFQTLSIDAGGAWTLNGANSVTTIANNGLVTVAGSLRVTGVVDAASAGAFRLVGGSSMEVAAAAGSGETVDFASPSLLTIDAPGLFGSGVGASTYTGPKLIDFGIGDTLDLRNFGAGGAGSTYDSATGLLQLRNAASQIATLAFDSASLGLGSFHFASDGAAGLLITRG